MKIGKIEHQENIYTVQLMPNFLEKLFGKKLTKSVSAVPLMHLKISTTLDRHSIYTAC
jgi:hypothetical protein